MNGRVVEWIEQSRRFSGSKERAVAGAFSGKRIPSAKILEETRERVGYVAFAR
jgi:hypothetical protein